MKRTQDSLETPITQAEQLSTILFLQQLTPTTTSAKIMETNYCVDFDSMDSESAEEVHFEGHNDSKVPFGEITNEFPYIDWVRVINVCNVSLV